MKLLLMILMCGVIGGSNPYVHISDNYSNNNEMICLAVASKPVAKETDNSEHNAVEPSTTENPTTENPTTENPITENPTTETPSTEEKNEEVNLKIDSDNCYEGMSTSYNDGYEPVVRDGKVHIILPLVLIAGELKNNEIFMKVDLGDTMSMPFINKNYSKTIIETICQNTKNENRKVYLVDVALDLRKDRINGSYPVLFDISGIDKNGQEISSIYTVYVNITDGKNPEGEITEKTEEEEITFNPKVLVTSCKASKPEVYAGDEVLLTITLKNTSDTLDITNMTVSADVQGEYFTLRDDSDTTYISHMSAGQTAEIKFNYKVNPGTPQGQYNISINMDYADLKGRGYSENGNARIDILQPVKVEFDDLLMAIEAKVGETIDASISAMNLGRSKLYNVRAVMECDGLKPAGTFFIGDLEPGSTKAAATRVSVGSLAGDNSYGTTVGTITYYYEDEAGNEYEEKREMTFVVKTPFSENRTENEIEDEPKQWWGLMTCVLGVLVFFGVTILARKIRNRDEDE